MNLKINLFLLALLGLLSCNSSTDKTTTVITSEVKEKRDTYVHSDRIIEVDELKNLVGNDRIKIIHFGKPEDYNKGHIPTSVNIWRSDIQDAKFAYNGMMSSKAQIENLFSRLGITHEDTLIVYDPVASCDAARLWWVLKNYGFNNLRILNGGIQAWKENKGLLVTDVAVVKKTQFIFPDASPMMLYVNKEEMLRALSSTDSIVIIDTRTNNEFTGKRQKKGALSGGRIPKSRLVDWASCVNYDGNKKFKTYTELSKIYKAVIPHKDTQVIAYCHSGVRSAHTTFVMTELLGYKNVKNYDGSWTEWSHFENYPKEMDSLTTLLQ